MRTKRCAAVLALLLTIVMGMALTVNAESETVNGYCYFDGSRIVSDFSSGVVADTIKGLQPGDDVTFRIKFENRNDKTTHWYMRNETLQTLEQSYDRTRNGGYTYILTHVDPSGNRQTLFDNSAVGGEFKMPVKDGKTSRGTVNTGEGLHQATNALDDWFFIQTLKKGEAGYTELYVKFEAETEGNDYMDTAGKLLLAYAVEPEAEDSVILSYGVRTGDRTNLLSYVATFLAALLFLILTILSSRRDRRRAGAEAAAGSSMGKERE